MTTTTYQIIRKCDGYVQRSGISGPKMAESLRRAYQDFDPWRRQLIVRPEVK